MSPEIAPVVCRAKTMRRAARGNPFADSTNPVNRWFANRRRKQTKRTKTVPSPASVTPATVSQESTSRPTTPVSKENVMTQLTPDVISAFAQVCHDSGIAGHNSNFGEQSLFENVKCLFPQLPGGIRYFG
ncbi:hypothetical protein NECAME_00955 [Necator americanus]|uniref:Uncharacterized protein n=1 Tax=Necator americanus TaxID=51031 RepID=W2SMR4_NECAM|nr:hypothetical protein NECAME_00955 [Necator americanus]ETN70007.1 hypothetical protein NECAME_00955 [Necator americanus]